MNCYLSQPVFGRYYQPINKTEQHPSGGVLPNATLNNPVYVPDTVNTLTMREPFFPQKEAVGQPPVTSNFLDNRNCDFRPDPNPYMPPSRKQCNDVVLPFPQPIQLSNDLNFSWDYEDRLKRDCCAVTLDEKESQRPGYYQLSGYDPHRQNADNYANRMNEIMHFQKVYNDPYHYVDDESDLTHAELSNLREINQLFTRPYAGFFMGPGMPSLDNKDLESALQQGLLTNLRQKPCEVTRGTTFYRYQCLPEFGNPQRTQHIIPPVPEVGGWIRSGDATRDYVRRVDYQRRCLNKVNGNIVNKVPKCALGTPSIPAP